MSERLSHEQPALDVAKLRSELNRHHQELQALRHTLGVESEGDYYRPDDDKIKSALWDSILEAEFWALRSRGRLDCHYPEGGAS